MIRHKRTNEIIPIQDIFNDPEYSWRKSLTGRLPKDLAETIKQHGWRVKPDRRYKRYWRSPKHSE
jgi:hypothetical protein